MAIMLPRSILDWTTEPKLDGWRARLAVHQAPSQSAPGTADRSPTTSHTSTASQTATSPCSHDFYWLAGALAPKSHRTPDNLVRPEPRR